MPEIWKDILGYEDKYQVSSKGRIRNLERQVRCRGNKLRTIKEKVRKPQIKKDGYHIATLCDGIGNVCTYTVHQLVAQAFIPNFIKGMQVNHIDGNPGNNCVENLEISNSSHNQLHALHILKVKPKYGKTSKFNNVSYINNPSVKNKWAACLSYNGKSSYGWKTFSTEEDAAKYVDYLLDSINDTIRPRNFP